MMMSSFELGAAIVSVAALFGYVNQRWIRRPPAIVVMALTLGVSMVLVALEKLCGLDVGPLLRALERVRLDEALLHGMLGALLFAGALHVRVSDLRRHRATVGILALVGTLVSTALIGGLSRAALRALGSDIDWPHALLFGAIVSPTDPVAVLGILKEANVPASTKIQIAGESLFNDGIGVVVFTTLLAFTGEAGTTATATAMLFLREAVGGALFGALSGYAVYRLLRTIDHYPTELLLTLALAAGGYALAERLHLSAPIAAVVAGLVIGDRGRALGMSDDTRERLDTFWSLVDEVLNAVLFVLVGLEVLRLQLTPTTIVAAVLAIPITLLARWVSVGSAIGFLSRFTPFARGTVTMLTWGGLRGGISVALALSIPAGGFKDLIVSMTYFVVVFSVLVQGLTLATIARRFPAEEIRP